MISIIIPAHNEEKYIYSNLKAFIGQGKDLDFEIIIVENGSIDRTLEICRKLEFNEEGLIRIFSLSEPSYGRAIKKGITEAKGEYLFILEADCMSLDFVRAGLSLLKQANYEVIVGSKQHPESIDRRGYKRYFLTWAFNLLLRLIFGFRGTDTHGLKAFTIQSAKRLISLSETEGEALQTELVLLSQIYGVPIKEVPVQIEETRTARISILGRVPKVSRGVIDIWQSVRRHNKILRML